MKSGRLQTLLFLAVFTAVSALAGCSSSGPGEENTRKAPEFTLENLDGKDVSMKDFANKVVVVDFWATWCGPCREEIPHLNKLYSEYRNKGFVIVGISMDTDGPDLVRQFVSDFKMEYPVVIGNDNVTEEFGGIIGLPTKFVIDRKGNIVYKYVGYQVEELERTIRKLVG